jgi:type II secretory pathway pseudopilin PulG
MNACTNDNRAGITLMEVLISLGILSIGLASVVSLVPAGGSQAKLAMIEDRRAAVSTSALADAINRGILNPSKWSTVPTEPFVIAVDPLGSAAFPSSMTSVVLAGVAPGNAADAVFRCADDVVYDLSQSEDAPPVPRFFQGTSLRLSEGRFSWMATLTPETNGGTASQYYKLSVITFYNRAIPPDVANPVFENVTMPDPSSAQVPCSLNTDTFRAIFTRGTVVLLSAASQRPVWRKVLMAQPTESAGTVTNIDLALDRPLDFTATTVHTYQGAIGVAEQTVMLEENSPWLQ